MKKHNYIHKLLQITLELEVIFNFLYYLFMIQNHEPTTDEIDQTIDELLRSLPNRAADADI